jgi:DNA invertase Pin-like site-specific DNA recombinase
LYLRVSTGEQTVENQRRELEAVAARHGWEIAAVFADGPDDYLIDEIGRLAHHGAGSRQIAFVEKGERCLWNTGASRH